MTVQQRDDSQSHRCSMAMLNPVSQPGTCGWRCCCCCTVPSVLPLSAALLLYCTCGWRCCCTAVPVLLPHNCCCSAKLQKLHTFMQSAKPNTIALQPDKLHGVGDCQLTALLCRCLVLCWIDNTFEHSFLQQLLFSALESVNLV